MVSSESAFTFTASPLDCHLERGNSSLLSIGTGSEPQDWSSCYQYFTSIKASHGLEGLYVPPEHVCSHWLLIQPSEIGGVQIATAGLGGVQVPLQNLGAPL